MDIYTEIVNLRSRRQDSVLVTVVAREGHVPTQLKAKMLVGAEGRLAGTVGGGAVELHAIEEAREVLARRKPLLQEFLLDDREDTGEAKATGMICGGRVTMFFEILGTGIPVYLFGAGHVSRALRDFLTPLDFHATFIDCRPEQLADLDAPHLAAGEDYRDLPELPDLAKSYVVIATHSHICDERVLEHVLVSGARPLYLGVVASRRKREQMYANIRGRLGADLDLDWVYTPVGLDLGGNTPAALALSIAAEMQAERFALTGHAHMRDRRHTSPGGSK